MYVLHIPFRVAFYYFIITYLDFKGICKYEHNHYPKVETVNTY